MVGVMAIDDGAARAADGYGATRREDPDRGRSSSSGGGGGGELKVNLWSLASSNKSNHTFDMQSMFSKRSRSSRPLVVPARRARSSRPLVAPARRARSSRPLVAPARRARSSRPLVASRR